MLLLSLQRRVPSPAAWRTGPSPLGIRLRPSSSSSSPSTSAAASAVKRPQLPPPPPRSAGAFRRAWAAYTTLLETRPVLTKVLTAGAIAGAGDVGCQLAIERAERLDVPRAAIFTALGGGLVAPVLHLWYNFLRARAPGLGTSAVLRRLALDQLGFAPTFLPIFFASLLTLEGVPETIPAKLRADWWPTIQANWVVWVPAQLLNFRFVPGHLQVLFANVVGLFWNAYLSYVSHAIAADGADDQGGKTEASPRIEQKAA